MVAIVMDSDIRSGDPCIEETRISVLDIKRRVIDGDEDPFAVTAEYDFDGAAVFDALAYCYDNAETMRERRLKRPSGGEYHAGIETASRRTDLTMSLAD